MNEKPKLKLKSGGQWLISLIRENHIFCRETFSEQHKDVDKLITDFSREKIYPNIFKIDKFNEKISKNLLTEMGDLGLLGVDAPEEYGGLNLDKITACIIAEGVQRGGSASFGCTFGVQTAIGTLGIVFFGTPKQKEKFLPDLLSGKKIAAYGLTEPSSGSDALSAKTHAQLSKDKKFYILNGEKQFISNGGWADVFTILAQIDKNEFSAFIVEKDTEGLTVGSEEKKMGVKGSSTTSLKFNDAKIPRENLLFKVGKGAEIAFSALNIGRYKLAAATVGGSKLAIELSIQYAKERKQFGQPIANFDSIKGKIADMSTKVYAADTMLYRTVGMIQEAINDLDQNSQNYYEQMGKTMERFSIESSMAKVYGSETSDMVVDTSLQIFGGYGFIEEYPIAMAYRDDRINRIWEGTNEINRSIITGYMMKKVLMEEISLRDFIKETGQSESRDSVLHNEEIAINYSKKIACLIFNSALIKFGQDLKHEQQLSESLADIFTNIFVAESVLLRVRKSILINNKHQICITFGKVLIEELFQEIKSLTPKCINRIFGSSGSDKVRNSVNYLKNLITLDQDIISLKNKIADFMYKQKRYPF